MSHKVYIMRTTNFSKIGITSGSIKNRINQVQTGTPTKIYRVEYFIVRNRTTALMIEAELHEKLKRRRTYGEWFKNLRHASKELTNSLKELGINREDAKIIELGRAEYSEDELSIVSCNIDKCLKDTDFDRLIGLGKKLMINPTVSRVREIELKYKGALEILQNRHIHCEAEA